MTAVSGQTVSALAGSPFPLGASVRDGGTNFAVASTVADGMLLCLSSCYPTREEPDQTSFCHSNAELTALAHHPHRLLHSYIQVTEG